MKSTLMSVPLVSFISTHISGMSIQAMDSSHVALVTMSLSMEGFESYRADGNMVLGISIPNLSKVLKLANNDDSLTLSAQTDGSHLKVVFENEKNGRTTTFDLNMITIDVDHLAIPETEYGSVISLSSSEFGKLTREFHALSESVTIKTHPDYVQFSIEGEVGSGSTRLTASDGEKREEQTCIEVKEPVELQFSLRYLTMFAKAATLSTQTRLLMENEQPLAVEFQMPELGYIKYFLAPKISDE